MRITPHVAATFVLLLAATVAPAAGAVVDVSHTPLVIRLYDAASPADEPALEEAAAILNEAGFTPEWVRCAAAGPAAPARCDVPLGHSELAVRVVLSKKPAPASATLPLGYSLVDPQTRSGALATIYLDRVAWLAVEAGADLRVLLGRAIVHEIGHLLLGTNQHAHTGVMRAIWSRQAVRDDKPKEWRFLDGEARRMRAALQRRTAAGQVAKHIVWGD